VFPSGSEKNPMGSARGAGFNFRTREYARTCLGDAKKPAEQAEKRRPAGEVSPGGAVLTSVASGVRCRTVSSPKGTLLEHFWRGLRASIFPRGPHQVPLNQEIATNREVTGGVERLRFAVRSQVRAEHPSNSRTRAAVKGGTCRGPEARPGVPGQRPVVRRRDRATLKGPGEGHQAWGAGRWGKYSGRRSGSTKRSPTRPGGGRQVVVVPDRERLEPPLPDLPGGPGLGVVSADVGGQEPLHPGAQVPVPFGR